MYADKYEESTYNEGTLTKKFTYKIIEDVTPKHLEILDEIFGIDTSDYEGAYANGIIYNWDDFHSIEVDKITEAINEYFEQVEEDEEDEDDYPQLNILKEIYDKLEKYEGYTIYYEWMPEELKK